MNPICSIGLPDGSLTLVGSMRTSHVLPSDVEFPRRVLEVLGVTGAIGIYAILSSKVFSTTILKSNVVFIAFCELSIVVIDPSRDSCTYVAMPS